MQINKYNNKKEKLSTTGAQWTN